MNKWFCTRFSDLMMWLKAYPVHQPWHHAYLLHADHTYQHHYLMRLDFHASSPHQPRCKPQPLPPSFLLTLALRGNVPTLHTCRPLPHRQWPCKALDFAYASTCSNIMAAKPSAVPIARRRCHVSATPLSLSVLELPLEPPPPPPLPLPPPLVNPPGASALRSPPPELPPELPRTARVAAAGAALAALGLSPPSEFAPSGAPADAVEPPLVVGTPGRLRTTGGGGLEPPPPLPG